MDRMTEDILDVKSKVYACDLCSVDF